MDLVKRPSLDTPFLVHRLSNPARQHHKSDPYPHTPIYHLNPLPQCFPPPFLRALKFVAHPPKPLPPTHHKALSLSSDPLVPHHYPNTATLSLPSRQSPSYYPHLTKTAGSPTAPPEPGTATCSGQGVPGVCWSRSNLLKGKVPYIARFR